MILYTVPNLGIERIQKAIFLQRKLRFQEVDNLTTLVLEFETRI